MGAEKCFSFKGVNARASTRIWARNARRLACRPSRDALFKTQIQLTRVQSALWANHPLLGLIARCYFHTHSPHLSSCCRDWRKGKRVSSINCMPSRDNMTVKHLLCAYSRSESLRLQTRVVHSKAKYDIMTTLVLGFSSVTISRKQK